jgi:hypothetical protein
MTTTYTPLLNLALPTEGELDGAWGDVVNDSVTSLIDDSIAGFATASVTSANWTLTTTGSGFPNQARMAILIPTGTPGVSRNIIAPSYSKTYIVINQSNAAVVLKGAATTGLTIAVGAYALAAWDGTDFVQIGKSGTVTTASVVSANGFAGTVATASTTPALTLSTSVTGMLKGNGTAMSAATAGTDYVSPTGTETLTNKNIQSRVVASTTNTTPVVINADTTDMATLVYTSAGTVVINAPTGTPVNGQKLLFRMQATSANSLTWNAIFAGAATLTLPTAATGTSKYDYMGFIYNSTASKWQLVAKVQGF